MSVGGAALPPLEDWRAADWRFLLPPAALGRTGVLGNLPDAERAVLRASGLDLVPAQGASADDDRLDLLVVTEPDRAGVHTALGTVRAGGWIAVRLHARSGRSRLRRVERALPPTAALSTGWTAYWHAPNAARCSYLVALDDRCALGFVLRRHQGVRFGAAKSLAARSLVALGMARLLARDVTLVAQVRAPHGETGTPGRAGRARGSRVLVTPWFEASRHVVELTVDPGTGAVDDVVKMPRRRGDTGAVRHEAAVLSELARRVPELRGRFPEVRGLVSGRRPALRESPVHGVALGPEVVRAEPERVIRAGEEFVRALPVTSSTDDDPGWFERLLERPLERLASSGAVAPGDDGLVERTLDALAPLRSAGLPLVVVHGDLSHPNLIRTPAGLLGAIDWERSDRAGLPLQDLCFFLQYVAEARRGAVARPDQLAAFDRAFVGSAAEARPALLREASRLGMPTGLVPALVVATWTIAAAGLPGRLEPAMEGPLDAVRPSTLQPAARDTFRQERDVALWRHAVARCAGIVGAEQRLPERR